MKKKLLFLSVAAMLLFIMVFDGCVNSIGTISPPLAPSLKDFDGDGVADYLEEAGYYWDKKAKEFREWRKVEGTFGIDYFKTDPQKYSTDMDPYGDGMEVRKRGLPSLGVGGHPLIAAYPRLVAKSNTIVVTPKYTITSTKGETIANAWEIKTETGQRASYSYGTTYGSEISYSLTGPNASVKVEAFQSKEHETITTESKTDSGWNTRMWNEASTTKTDMAAKLDFNLSIFNSGTASANDVDVTFNVKIGKKVIDTFKPSIKLLSIKPGTETKTFNVGESSSGKEITVSLNQLKSIDCGVPLSIEPFQIDAKVKRFSEETKEWKWKGRWVDYKDEFEGCCATVILDRGRGNTMEHKVYAGAAISERPVTLQEAFLWTKILQKDGDEYKVGNDILDNNWTIALSENARRELDTVKNIMDLKLKPGWAIILRTPRNEVPKIHWASYSEDMKTVYASVSDDDNISLVLAWVKIGDHIEKVEMKDSDGDLIYKGKTNEAMKRDRNAYVQAEDVYRKQSKPFSLPLAEVDRALPDEFKPGVTLFQEPNYKGNSETFLTTDSDLIDNLGIGKNQASSVTVTNGFVATVYDKKYFKGKSLTLRENCRDLNQENIGEDNILSLKVAKTDQTIAFLAIQELNLEKIDFEKYDCLAAGDLDGDGRSEIVHADRDDLIIKYSIINDDIKKDSFSTEFDKNDRLAVGDINGDGKEEIIIGDRNDWIRIKNDIGDDINKFKDDFGRGDRITAGDIDGDGLDEVIIGDTWNKVRIYKYADSWRLFKEFPRNFDSGDDLATGDINGDGKDEIVIADAKNGSIDIYNYKGANIGSFSHPFRKGDALAVGDLDGDGIDEIVTAHHSNDSIQILNYQGKKLYTQKNWEFEENEDLTVGDLDGDGRDEIIISDDEREGDRVFYLTSMLQ